MTTSLAPEKPKVQTPVINDFSIHVATVNGSGSQTANNILLRSIFQMGVPVSAQEPLPVQHRRACRRGSRSGRTRTGYIARKAELGRPGLHEPGDGARGRAGARPGAAVSSTTESAQAQRGPANDVDLLPVPFHEARRRSAARTRSCAGSSGNMIYVGVLAELLGIDMQEIVKALEEAASRASRRRRDINLNAVAGGPRLGEGEPRRSATRSASKRMNKTAGKILIDGNTAAAIGCVFAGVTVLTWYPITPSSSLVRVRSSTTSRSTGSTRRRGSRPSHRPGRGRAGRDRHGARRRLGGRARDDGDHRAGHLPDGASSSDSAYYAEIPAVIFDVQRTGPTTGLPTRTMQGDILQCANLSHGDTKHILLFPGDSPRSATRWRGQAFDLAERFQTPVFVMTRPRPRHEQLDVRPLRVSRASRSTAARSSTPRSSTQLASSGPLQGRGRRRHPVPDAARHRRT